MLVRYIYIIIGIAIIAGFTGCRNDKSLLPRSGGEPYEVLLMTDDADVRSCLDSILTTDVVGLPQSENLCKVSHSTLQNLNQSTRYARCIVKVNIGKSYPKTRIIYEKNVFAEPQLVVNINTPTKKELKVHSSQIGKQLIELIDRFELNAEIALLKRRSNTQNEKVVEKTFGWQLKIPVDMTAMKCGHNFIWLSNNAPTGMQNICVYTYKGINLDAKLYLDKRDSIMKKNIPGEQPGMYMATERQWLIIQRFVKEHNRVMLKSQGLWQMEGDAMGGPFVSIATVDSTRKEIIVAEGFVYAPEMKKRNKIKQLEAAIYTLTKVDK